ncbi:MAG: protein kinase [Polyangiaceae bacterium]|nr:protein kinase [Polyangiaceae bacterium]
MGALDEPVGAETHDTAPLPSTSRAPRGRDLGAGDLIAGKYRLGERLGAGGMGVVFRATHLRLGTEVAVKLLARGRDAAVGRARLLREARALSSLSSPYVVRMFDADVLPDGRAFLVLELVDGPSLATVLAEGGRLPGAVARRLIVELATALADAHALGLVHRDVKPSNILLRRERGELRVKLADFGIVRAPGLAGDATLTGGGLVGSPHFVAPEQIRAPKEVDARADLFSLGATAYLMVTGRLPFDGDGSAAVVAAIVADEPVPVTRLAPHAPRDLVTVIERCLQKRPELRPASAREVLALLADEHEPAPVTRRAVGTGRRASAGIAAALALSGAVSVWGLSRTTSGAAPAAGPPSAPAVPAASPPAPRGEGSTPPDAPARQASAASPDARAPAPVPRRGLAAKPGAASTSPPAGPAPEQSAAAVGASPLDEHDLTGWRRRLRDGGGVALVGARERRA